MTIRTLCCGVPNTSFHQPDSAAASTVRTATTAVPAGGTTAHAMSGASTKSGVRTIVVARNHRVDDDEQHQDEESEARTEQLRAVPCHHGLLLS